MLVNELDAVSGLFPLGSFFPERRAGARCPGPPRVGAGWGVTVRFGLFSTAQFRISRISVSGSKLVLVNELGAVSALFPLGSFFSRAEWRGSMPRCYAAWSGIAIYCTVRPALDRTILNSENFGKRL